MFRDFNVSTTDEAVLEADICIIGSGAAGITLARSLEGSGLRVLLLESGGADYEEPVQALNAGTSTGVPYYDLDHARLRLFGGTTNIWGGRVAELDPIDFERRDWVPGSGWPFGRAELDAYYSRARAALDLPGLPGNTLAGFHAPFNAQDLRVAFWQFDFQADRFAIATCSDLKRSANITCLLHATATELRAADDGQRIEEVRIANLRGGARARPGENICVGVWRAGSDPSAARLAPRCASRWTGKQHGYGWALLHGAPAWAGGGINSGGPEALF